MELTELNLINNSKEIIFNYLFFINYTFKLSEHHGHSTGHTIVQCENNVFETAELTKFCTIIRGLHSLQSNAVVIINNFILLKTIQVT